MDPTTTRPVYARKRPRGPAPPSAPTQSRMHKSRSRGQNRSTHILGSQAIQPSSQRSYQQPFNRVPQGRLVPVRDYYDRQPRFVGTPEDVEDDKMLYPDEEASVDQDSDEEEPLSQSNGAILGYLLKIESQLSSLSQESAELKKQQAKANAVLKHVSHQTVETSELLKEVKTTTHETNTNVLKLPHEISQGIVRVTSEQSNLPTQGSTNPPASFPMGLDPTVNPSNLMSNNRAGQGNNGGQG